MPLLLALALLVQLELAAASTAETCGEPTTEGHSLIQKQRTSKYGALDKPTEKPTDVIADNTCTPIENHGSYFTIPLVVGSKDEKVDLIVDTGSSALVVSDCACESCRLRERCVNAANSSTNKLNCFKDSDGASLPIAMNIEYASGGIHGYIANDRVLMGSVESEVKLMVVREAELDFHTEFQGIVGLGVPMNKTSILEYAKEVEAEMEKEATEAKKASKKEASTKEASKEAKEEAKEASKEASEKASKESKEASKELSEKASKESKEASEKRKEAAKSKGAAKSKEATKSKEAPESKEAPKATAAKEAASPTQAQGVPAAMHEENRTCSITYAATEHSDQSTLLRVGVVDGFLEQLKAKRFSMCFNSNKPGVLRINQEKPSPEHTLENT